MVAGIEIRLWPIPKAVRGERRTAALPEHAVMHHTAGNLQYGLRRLECLRGEQAESIASRRDGDVFQRDLRASTVIRSPCGSGAATVGRTSRMHTKPTRPPSAINAAIGQ